METTNQPESFKIIDSILIKLDRLQSMLKPITASIPTNVKEKMSNTELQGALNTIDTKLSDLLDTIKL